MSPENANVFLAEDDQRWRDVVKKVLHDSLHEVVIEAVNFEEALELASQARKMGVDVAIVDANLSPDAVNGHQGRAVAKVLKEHVPDIKIVALSGNPQDYGVWVNKRDFDSVRTLGQTIKDL